MDAPLPPPIVSANPPSMVLPHITLPPDATVSPDCLCKPSCTCNPCNCATKADTKRQGEYAKVYAAVGRGEIVYTNWLPGEPLGYYRCWLDGAKFVYANALPPQPMPLFVPGNCPGGICPVR